jgi:hypothetical protein
MKRRLAIVTPTREGLVDINYTSSLVESVKMIDDWDVKPTIISGASDIIGARNTLFNSWYWETDVEAMMFIDSDISWNPHDLKRWLAIEGVGVLAGNYAKKKVKPLTLLQTAQIFQTATGEVDPEKVMRAHFDYVSTGTHNEIVGGEFKGLHSVDGIGLGFMLVHREAADILMNWAASNMPRCKVNTLGEKDDLMGYAVFDPFVDENAQNWREDFAFCRRLKNAGLVIFMDSRVPLRHTGYTAFDGEFYAQLELVKHVKANPDLTLPEGHLTLNEK